jgi:hypothetical protein
MPEDLTEKPLPLALLLADQVYQDRESGKWVVAGIFSSIGFRALPGVQNTMSVFFQVTNISAPVELRLRVEHADGDATVLDVGGPIRARDPLEVISSRIVLRNVPFQKQGKYWVQLLSGQEILTQVPLHVSLVSPPAPPAEGGGG